MRKGLSVFLVIGFSSLTAWAAEEDTVKTTETTSTTEVSEVTEGYLKNEFIGIKPQIGAIFYRDQQDTMTSRALGGIGVEANVMPMLLPEWKQVYLGPSTGVLYSHLGDPSSNFVGTNPISGAGTGGANLLIVPANIKAGYNITDRIRTGLHGGGNLVYRSMANSMMVGTGTPQTGAAWSFFPNLGADIELGIGKHSALSLRPDMTFAPGNIFYTGTLALSIPMG